MRKYGQENFKWYILEKCDEKQLINRENFYIKKFGDYNIGVAADGGDNITNNPRKNEIDWNTKARVSGAKKRWTKKEKEKQSIISKSQWTKQKQEKLLIGLKKKYSNPDFVKKYVEKQRRPGGAYSPEIIKKRSNTKAKKWILYDPQGNKHIIKNLNKFCKENGFSSGALHNVSTGKRNHHKGWRCFKWH